jgi:hypothetical protein
LKSDIKELVTLVYCDADNSEEEKVQYDALCEAWKRARMMEAVTEQLSEIIKKLREHHNIGS